MKTIFPTDKPYMDEECMYVPTDIIQIHMTDLTASEWLYLLYSGMDFNAGIKSLGSRTTIWRIKKSLQRKDYL